MIQKITEKCALISQFITQLPYSKALGLKLETITPGEATLIMPYNPDYVGDPTTGVLHGGAVFALMDTTCGAAAMSHPDGGLGTATLDLRISYMRAARPEQAIRAVAVCTHVTRSVAFVTATAYDDDASSPVATGSGTFTVPSIAGVAE